MSERELIEDSRNPRYHFVEHPLNEDGQQDLCDTVKCNEPALWCDRTTDYLYCTKHRDAHIEETEREPDETDRFDMLCDYMYEKEKEDRLFGHR